MGIDILSAFIGGVVGIIGKWAVDMFIKNLEYKNAYFKEIGIKRIQYLEKMLDALDPLVTVRINKEKDEVLNLFFSSEQLDQGSAEIISAFSKRFFLEEMPKSYCDEILYIMKNISTDKLNGMDLDGLNEKYKNDILEVAPNAAHMIQIQILEGHNIKAILKQARDPRYKLKEEHKALKEKQSQRLPSIL